jgi:hypothetical protein
LSPRASLAALGFALASMIGALAWSQANVDGSDLWWHLAAGRNYADAGAITRTDPFSHTARGRPWINHEWLWDRAAWAAYHGHEDWLAWGHLALIGATFGLVAARARRTSGSWVGTCASVWLAGAASHWYLDLRPQIATFFGVALLLATLEWRRAPWLWPPLLALWANLHGGYVFGLAVLGLHALDASESAVSDRAARARALRIWAGVAAAALAVCLNPWGISIYGVPFQTLAPDTPFRDLIEWHHTPLSLDPTSYAGRFAWMAIATAIGCLVRPRDAFSLALAAITAAMAVSARRFVPLFAIVAAPLAARGFAAGTGALQRALPRARDARLELAGASLALIAALALWRGLPLTPHLFQRWTFEQSFPSGATAYLAAMPAPPQHLFALYEWGGYLMLHAPSVPVFLDGRAGTVYPDEVARDYAVLAGAEAGWRKVLATYQVDAVLMPAGATLARALARGESGWRVAHADPRSTLLLAPSIPIHEDVALPGADLYLSRGAAALARGDLRDAKQELELARSVDPLLFATYVELMLVAARSGEPSKIRDWAEAALAADSRWSDRVWLAAADAYAGIGDAAAERDALRRVGLRGPFIDDGLRDLVRSRVRAAEARSGG